MLSGNLLISGQATTIIIIACAVVFAIALILYGVFRKFNQMGWLPWQIIIIFFIALGAGKIPDTLNPTLRLSLVAGVFLVGSGVVLGIGAVIRYAMLVRVRPAPIGYRVLNRILGAITSVLGFVVFVGAIAAFVLPVGEHAVPPVREILSVVYESAFWKTASGYVFDFFVVAIFVSAIQAGYRVGFGRGLLTILMCASALGSLVLAVYLTVAVPAFHAVGQAFAKGIHGTPLVSTLVGYGLAVLMWVAVFFNALALIWFFTHKLVKKMRYIRPLGVIGGMLCSVIFFAFLLTLTFGVDTLVLWLSNGGFKSTVEGANVSGLSNVIASVEEYAGYVANAFKSSAFSRALFECNPLAALLPS